MPEQINPAAEAARIALEKLYKALDERKNFIFEAGAGAGKTYSLIKALHHLIEKDGKYLLKAHKRIACITYTNVAKEEIDNRTDRHPVVHSDTIHAFCWSIIRNFQDEIRKILPGLGRWEERIKDFYTSTLPVEIIAKGEISGPSVTDINLSEVLGKKEIIYQLGYPSVDEYQITLHHDDVLNLMVELLNKEKFRKILFSKYPVILIDEYQDTFTGFAESLQTHFINQEVGPLVGFFGDHWQKIYGNGCGKIENSKLVFIPKNANFRSDKTIVQILNHMRPDLLQEVENPNALGTAFVYHTNNWEGTRRSGTHWGGDLPAEQAHDYITYLRGQLGWDYAPESTKILMLTHNVLADAQGYRQLADVFSNTDSFIKKEDKYIAFFMDYLEPICEAFTNKKYGQMFDVLGSGKNGIYSHDDKVAWTTAMERILELRANGTIGEIIDYLAEVRKPKLPENIEIAEKKLREYVAVDGVEEPSSITKSRNLRSVPYKEVVAVTKFVNNHTPFATNHSVKGEEYENVLVVIGRGWNQYNFVQMLGWFSDGIPAGKQDTFERSRNLFYVACSRPKNNLVVLFTQEVSPSAMATLTSWFGATNVIALPAVIPTLN